MKLSKKNYSDFLAKNIFPKYKIIESERLAALRNFIFFELICLFVILMNLIKHRHNIFILIFGALIIVLGTFILFNFIFKKYRTTYKKRILPILFQEIFDEYEYYPELKLKEEDFVSTLIFQEKYNRYSGEDYLEGTFEGHDIKLSELLVKYVDRNNRRSKKSERIIFDGVMILIRVSTQVKSETILFPDHAEKYLGRLGKTFQFKTKLNHEIVHLESSEFEKEFKLCSSDQVEARKIFTPLIQEKILDLKKKTRYDFYFSIQPRQLSIAISTSDNFFEPEYFQSNFKSKSVRNALDLFLFINDLMENLKLE